MLQYEVNALRHRSMGCLKSYTCDLPIKNGILNFEGVNNAQRKYEVLLIEANYQDYSKKIK